MKFLFAFFFALASIFCHGQKRNPKTIDSLERKALSLKYPVRFEQLDTVDEEGRRFLVNRSYYFDNNKENLLLITAFENQVFPRRGLRVLYTFSDNQVVKIRTIPSKYTCRKCNAAYYFDNDSLFQKKEIKFSVKNTGSLLKDSKKLASKVVKSGG
jgi:hypothetical protein